MGERERINSSKTACFTKRFILAFTMSPSFLPGFFQRKGY